jgi:hypothetical protein
MASPSVFYIEDLTPEHLELLTQLLSFTPGYPINTDTSWLRDQTSLLSTFPPSLLKPSSILPRLAMGLLFSSWKATLCNTHKSLNPYLIHRIFLEVSAECTAHLERLLENDHHLPPHLQAFVRRMQALNGLWMSPKFYRSLFIPWHVMPSDFRFDRIDSGCEACILASVGGNHQTLSDLRASILGRRKRDRPCTQLLEVVEAWIDWTGRGDIIRSESNMLGREIGKCRRQMQEARRLKRSNTVEGILGYDQEWETGGETLIGWKTIRVKEAQAKQAGNRERQGDGRHGFEESIIDFYAKRMSTASLVHSVCTTEGLHEAFRELIVRDPIFGTFHPISPERGDSVAPKAFSESLYSNNFLATRTDGRSSEKRAQSYQNLLKEPEDNEDEEWDTESAYV